MRIGAAEAIAGAATVDRNRVSKSGSPGMSGSYPAALTASARRAAPIPIV
jgi:hypothetical protein